MFSEDKFILNEKTGVLMKRKTKAMTIYKCTWRDEGNRNRCNEVGHTWEAVAEHVLRTHLNGKHIREDEADFYVVDELYEPTCSPPTKSHWDMVRPRSEDPEYQKQIRQAAAPAQFNPPIPSVPHPETIIIGDAYIPPMNVPAKQLKPAPMKSIPQFDHQGNVLNISLSKMQQSPRRVRGETKKCRKVYGMEHKELWCTQCKWKKACTRFMD